MGLPIILIRETFEAQVLLRSTSGHTCDSWVRDYHAQGSLTRDDAFFSSNPCWNRGLVSLLRTQIGYRSLNVRLISTSMGKIGKVQRNVFSIIGRSSYLQSQSLCSPHTGCLVGGSPIDHSPSTIACTPKPVIHSSAACSCRLMLVAVLSTGPTSTS